MDRKENVSLYENPHPNTLFNDAGKDSILSTKLFLDYVGEVVLTLNSDGLSWKLVKLVHNEKTYVVFVGQKPDVYGTWEETHAQVNKFSGALHKSFSSSEEALRVFEAYIQKRRPTASFNASGEQSSCTTSSTSSQRNSTQAEKVVKLKEALLDLENENRNHVLRVAEKMDEIKRQLQGLQLSDDG